MRSGTSLTKKSHLNKAATLATIRNPKRSRQSINLPKFGVKGRTPGEVLNMFDASASGRYN